MRNEPVTRGCTTLITDELLTPQDLYLRMDGPGGCRCSGQMTSCAINGREPNAG